MTSDERFQALLRELLHACEERMGKRADSIVTIAQGVGDLFAAKPCTCRLAERQRELNFAMPSNHEPSCPQHFTPV